MGELNFETDHRNTSRTTIQPSLSFRETSCGHEEGRIIEHLTISDTERRKDMKSFRRLPHHCGNDSIQQTGPVNSEPSNKSLEEGTSL